MNSFFIMVDLWDLIQIQAYSWEIQIACVDFPIRTIVFFYAYLIILVAPSIALAEFSKNPDTNTLNLLYNRFIENVQKGSNLLKEKLQHFVDNSPMRLTMYSIFTLCLINLPLGMYRFVLIYFYKETRIGSIWIAKSLICTGIILMSYPWGLLFAGLTGYLKNKGRFRRSRRGQNDDQNQDVELDRIKNDDSEQTTINLPKDPKITINSNQKPSSSSTSKTKTSTTKKKSSQKSSTNKSKNHNQDSIRYVDNDRGILRTNTRV